MNRVLLVDDDPLVLGSLSGILSALEYEVETASDGHKAIEKLRGASYDVVLSDISMPGMDGIEFLRAVHESDLDLPVILMTGGPSLGTAVKAVEYGAFQYLEKPIRADALREVVQRAIRTNGLAKLKRQALMLVTSHGQWLGDQAELDVRFDKALSTLHMVFQPIISWRRRSLFAYEALVRSSEPTLAVPADLLAAAERLGRLPEMGRTIRSKLAAAAPNAPDGTLLLLNLHPSDLLDADLYSLQAPLSALAGRVVLEITERASIEGVSEIQSRIATLRRAGYRIAVDDLGAGYAGLSTLTQLEPEIIKLDMSLVRDIDTQATKQHVIRSMLQLSARLGLSVISEGVETPAERDTLTSLGCELMQGYLFARPEPEFVPPQF